MQWWSMCVSRENAWAIHVPTTPWHPVCIEHSQCLMSIEPMRSQRWEFSKTPSKFKGKYLLRPWLSVMVWVFVSPQTSYVQILSSMSLYPTSEGTVLGRGASGRCWGHESGAVVSGINAFIKGPQSSPAPRTPRTQWKGASYRPRRPLREGS